MDRLSRDLQIDSALAGIPRGTLQTEAALTSAKEVVGASLADKARKRDNSGILPERNVQVLPLVHDLESDIGRCGGTGRDACHIHGHGVPNTDTDGKLDGRHTHSYTSMQAQAPLGVCRYGRM